MTVTGLGTSRKGFRLPILPIISGGLLLVALIVFALELSRFALGRDVLQTDITVAGVPVTGLKISEAVSTWERIYDQPVQLDYQGSPILLNPAEIGFRTNNDLMLAELRSKSAGTNNYWSDFWNYLWQRPTSPISVDLISDYQEARLRNFLQDVAARYEQRVSGASFETNTLTFGPGAAGERLDVEASMKAIEEALHKPTNRKAKLVMHSEGAHAADMSTLKQAILDYFSAKGFLPDGQTTIASVVLIDLQNGQELSINPAVAYSALSTIKIPILLNIFRKLTFAPDKDTKWFMGASILCSSNSASNYLIQFSGTGNNARDQLANGLSQVTNTVQALGAKNTFISAPLYVGAKDYEFSIPAPTTKPDIKLDAKPDSYSQTTAEDMAILLNNLYDCSEYGSGLIAAFPDSYTQSECKQMVELLSGNVIGRMIELGVPPGTRVAHKNGWGKVGNGYNSSDAAIVYTPGGNYILSVYMWEKLQPGQEIGSLVPWETMEGISRIVYNYYNPNQALVTNRVPENPNGAIECVMPNPKHIELLDLNNINNGRFDANGQVLPDACYNYPQCDVIPDNKLGASDSPPEAQGTQTVQPSNGAPPLASTLPAQSGSTKPTELPPPPPK
ncbi:MAG: serine hydrolase [Chloroflexota bacterium]